MKKGLHILLLLALFFAAVACTPARKPAPTVPPGGSPTTLPTNQTELNKIAKKIAREAAKTEKVKKATAVITGSTAYVGLDLVAGVEKSETDKIKEEAANRVKSAEPRLKRVYVTTDADTVTRIRHVAEGLAKGRPLSSLMRELDEIKRRMVPKRK
ncbi:YhcN/YlaJ family sporulation lipoprotein [Carboxydothermus ferrireducens]|uniref:YhcN/YlaJ family sporulation lipoprotein n=1 Tax=Carboxydothermus ferrireducens DSM 11255 TaxID=1119529 RepID=A0ABX2REX9_9THEO|nr:YhcN/YlaJ family sporulation lipoprotein [Carboxydothermus ferrireducens]NYE58358.1 YhcN/YlaJ family sporulation lipoprotein [Carboxydothermus ferrireducens DSM 11255]